MLPNAGGLLAQAAFIGPWTIGPLTCAMSLWSQVSIISHLRLRRSQLFATASRPLIDCMTELWPYSNEMAGQRALQPVPDLPSLSAAVLRTFLVQSIQAAFWALVPLLLAAAGPRRPDFRRCVALGAGAVLLGYLPLMLQFCRPQHTSVGC